MNGQPPKRSEIGGDSADLTRLAGQKLGNFRLERLLGRGRMGAVYLAKDEALLRPTAVKILSWRTGDAQGQDPVQWFLAEARMVARINDPRVVQIYGAARQGDHCYIAMEYVAGRSAAAAVAEDGPMAPEAATDVLVQAASALVAAHRSGVVHRDIKPANLLMGGGGITKLGDFGMALGPSDLRPGAAHLRVGTPYYTAPEIWRGEAASPASDIYSLGATYFQLLTGSPPYPGTDVAAIEQAHLRAPVPDPRERVPAIPASCAALVRKALAKSPRDRHASAQELAWEGRRVLQELAAAGVASDPRTAAGPDREEQVPTSAPVAPDWVQALGFTRTPFADVDPLAPPYRGEPFSAVAALLASRADDTAGSVVALTGAEGSGRTVLCRRLAAELASTRLVVFADLAADPGGQGLMRRLGQALGASDPDAAGHLGAVVDRLVEERRRQAVPPLLVVDGVLSLPPPLIEILRAADVTRSFKVVAVGAPGLAVSLARGGLGSGERGIPEIDLPPLRSEQVLAYVNSWLLAALEGHARPVLFSPDALSLVALRSAGNLGLINRIVQNMLAMAASSRRRTLTTFEAWTAPDRERWAALPEASRPSRPAAWPTPEVVKVIDACRRSRGMRPWPRAENEGDGVAPDRSAAGDRQP